VPRSSNVKVKDVLEQEIISGALKPGARLEEVALTERFGVSRTPVREALLQLSSTGLVELRPRRGAIVATLSLKELIEMFEVMAELEGLCCQLAATRAGAEDRVRLREIHQSCEPLVRNRDFDSYYDANVLFHETIYAAAGNEYLAKMTMDLRTRLAPYRRLQLSRGNRIEESYAEHGQILVAIEAADPAKAEERMMGHVNSQSGTVSNFMASLPVELLKA
tara:strand:+ start:12512 stop:13174 length:663 start_codon:yes stop_codon:yes gene_type:complete